MAFLTVVGRFLAREVLERFGEDVLVEGRRVYAKELARGLGQKEAARIAATHMTRFAAKKSGFTALKAGGEIKSLAAKGAQLLREKLNTHKK